MCFLPRSVRENVTAVSYSLFNTSKNGPDFKEL